MEADDGVRVLMEALDTPGFDDDIPAKVRAEELLSHIENTFDEVFEEEQRIHRNPKFEEHRIHALAYFIEPTGLGLKDVDYEFMMTLASRVNIIPIVAKADSLTQDELAAFKQRLGHEIAEKGIPIFDFQKFASTEELSNVLKGYVHVLNILI